MPPFATGTTAELPVVRRTLNKQHVLVCNPYSRNVYIVVATTGPTTLRFWRCCALVLRTDAAAHRAQIDKA